MAAGETETDEGLLWMLADWLPVSHSLPILEEPQDWRVQSPTSYCKRLGRVERPYGPPDEPKAWGPHSRMCSVCTQLGLTVLWAVC